ncbi:MAG: hypothetical protein ACYCSQ_00445 [bacterium]
MTVKKLKGKFSKNLKAKKLNMNLKLAIPVVFTLSFLAVVFGILSYITADGKSYMPPFTSAMPVNVLRQDIVINTLWGAGSLCIIGVTLFIIDKVFYKKDQECVLCKDYEQDSCRGTEQDKYEGGYNCEGFSELKTANAKISRISKVIKDINLRVKAIRKDIKTIYYIVSATIALALVIILIIKG